MWSTKITPINLIKTFLKIKKTTSHASLSQELLICLHPAVAPPSQDVERPQAPHVSHDLLEASVGEEQRADSVHALSVCSSSLERHSDSCSSQTRVLTSADRLDLDPCYELISFLIEFIGVTPVSKIIPVSGTSFYHTPSVQGMACSPPE